MKGTQEKTTGKRREREHEIYRENERETERRYRKERRPVREKNIKGARQPQAEWTAQK